jgi:hypothetical protein
MTDLAPRGSAPRAGRIEDAMDDPRRLANATGVVSATEMRVLRAADDLNVKADGLEASARQLIGIAGRLRRDAKVLEKLAGVFEDTWKGSSCTSCPQREHQESEPLE